jgi:hypothetical protein
MVRACVSCNEKVGEEFGKLQGTIVKVVDKEKNTFLYVCSRCQKKEGWIERAKIKGT